MDDLNADITMRELRVPVDPSNLEEAANLVLELGSRRAAIHRYQDLINFDTDVGYQAASLLKAKIKRADEINAWSRCLNIFARNIGHNQDQLTKNMEAVNAALRDAGYCGEWDQSYEVPNSMILLTLLPWSSTYLELYMRLKENSDGSGLIGVKADYKNQFDSGFIFTSHTNAREVYNGVLDFVSDDCKIAIYRQDSDLVIQYGQFQTSCNIALALVYIVSLFNRAIKTQCQELKFKKVKGVSLPDTTSETAISKRGVGIKGIRPSTSDELIGYFDVMTYSPKSVARGNTKTIGDYAGVGAREFFVDNSIVVKDGLLIKPESDEFLQLFKRGYADITVMNTMKGKYNGYFTPDKWHADQIKYLFEDYKKGDRNIDNFIKLNFTSTLNDSYYKLP